MKEKAKKPESHHRREDMKNKKLLVLFCIQYLHDSGRGVGVCSIRKTATSACGSRPVYASHAHSHGNASQFWSMLNGHNYNCAVSL